MFEALKEQINIPPEALSRDSTSIKVLSNGERVREEQNDWQSIRKSREGWQTKRLNSAGLARERMAEKVSQLTCRERRPLCWREEKAVAAHGLPAGQSVFADGPSI